MDGCHAWLPCMAVMSGCNTGLLYKVAVFGYHIALPQFAVICLRVLCMALAPFRLRTVSCGNATTVAKIEGKFRADRSGCLCDLRVYRPALLAVRLP